MTHERREERASCTGTINIVLPAILDDAYKQYLYMATCTWRHEGCCQVIRTVEHRLQQQQQPPQLSELTQLLLCSSLLCSSNPSSAAKAQPLLVLQDRVVVPNTALSKKVPPIAVAATRLIAVQSGWSWRHRQNACSKDTPTA